MKNQKKVVCLGGGIGTVNLIAGLKEYVENISVVLSMADEGGSSGRLRRMYDIPPPGDLVSCMAASSKNSEQLTKILTYRFPGDRYGSDESLGGHKLGNLIMVALVNVTGSYDGAIALFQKLFSIHGNFIPATKEQVTISAETIEGKRIQGEENIDLGKYDGKRILSQVFLHPENAKAHPKALEKIRNADVIIAGPGDLYTTILPVLIVPEIATAIKTSAAQKLFIINVANKPFETKGYSVTNYLQAVEKHLGEFPFDTVIVNSNTQIPIPRKFRYQYVSKNAVSEKYTQVQVISKDLVNEAFPLYHSSQKLAKVVSEAI